MIQLIDDRLGTLALRDDPYCVVSFEIGSRASRPNIRQRALADGHVDDTVVGGGRAFTMTLRLNDKDCGPGAVTMQSLIDRLTPYMNQRRRPILRWSLPGSDGVFRQMVVRGDSLPIPVTDRKKLALIASFVSDGEITSPEQNCTDIAPADDDEQGRTYDMTYDRVYPVSVAIGDRIIEQQGNEAAHWRGTLYGDATGPYLRINGTEVRWDEDYNVPGGSAIYIDTRERTMFLNGAEADSVQHLTNFAEWQWEDLLLQPGGNQVRYGADVITSGSLTMCWHDTWAG